MFLINGISLQFLIDSGFLRVPLITIEIFDFTGLMRYANIAPRMGNRFVQ